MKHMAKDADDRYQSAAGWIYDLEQAQADLAATNLTDLRDLSGFEPGQRDVSEIFRIPQKLYGREQELAQLVGLYHQVCAGDKALCLVTGGAGTGKSALIHELQQPLTNDRGMFLIGKFGQYQRNIPYFAPSQAFKTFMHMLLPEPETVLEQWRAEIQRAVGPVGKVLTDVVPELALIIGPQPAIPELGGVEAQNRFNYVFQRFMEAIARPDHPIILFLDDLQWADSASLQALKILMTDPGLKYLYLIGAYRDNKVDDAHPLQLALNELRKTRVVIRTVHLDDLTSDHVAALLADTLATPQAVYAPENIRALAELITTKTHGNAFFTRHFLQRLYDEGHVTFTSPQGGIRPHKRGIRPHKGIR
jgi:predicted ATPase